MSLHTLLTTRSTRINMIGRTKKTINTHSPSRKCGRSREWQPTGCHSPNTRSCNRIEHRLFLISHLGHPIALSIDSAIERRQGPTHLKEQKNNTEGGRHDSYIRILVYSRVCQESVKSCQACQATKKPLVLPSLINFSIKSRLWASNVIMHITRRRSPLFMLDCWVNLINSPNCAFCVALKSRNAAGLPLPMPLQTNRTKVSPCSSTSKTNKKQDRLVYVQQAKWSEPVFS